MQSQFVAEVGIVDGRIFVRPTTGEFEHIYRAGKGVHWDQVARQLSHDEPQSWSLSQWYRQIVAAVADEYGVRLELTGKTIWSNVPAELRDAIEEPT